MLRIDIVVGKSNLSTVVLESNQADQQWCDDHDASPAPQSSCVPEVEQREDQKSGTCSLKPFHSICKYHTPRRPQLQEADTSHRSTLLPAMITLLSQ